MFERIVGGDAEEFLYLCAQGLEVFQKRLPRGGQKAFEPGQLLLAGKKAAGLGEKNAQFFEASFLIPVQALFHALQEGDAELLFCPFDGKIRQPSYDGGGVEPLFLSPFYALPCAAQFRSDVGDQRAVVMLLHILQGKIGYPGSCARHGFPLHGFKGGRMFPCVLVQLVGQFVHQRVCSRYGGGSDIGELCTEKGVFLQAGQYGHPSGGL